MMKISIAFVGVLAVVAGCGGKKAEAIDCAKAIPQSMGVSKDGIKKMPGMTDALISRMTEITLNHCTTDKWPETVVTCLAGTKNSGDVDTCMKSLPSELTVKWQNDMATVVPAVDPGAGSADGSAGSAATGSAGSGSAGSGSAKGSGSSASADLPPECVEYKSTIDRLAKCDKLPKPAREAYQQAYDKIALAFTTTTKDGRAQLASGCKSTVDVLKQSASATCGW